MTVGGRLTRSEAEYLTTLGAAVLAGPTPSERARARDSVVFAVRERHLHGVPWQVLADAVGVKLATLRRWRRLTGEKTFELPSTPFAPERLALGPTEERASGVFTTIDRAQFARENQGISIVDTGAIEQAWDRSQDRLRLDGRARSLSLWATPPAAIASTGKGRTSVTSSRCEAAWQLSSRVPTSPTSRPQLRTMPRAFST